MAELFFLFLLGFLAVIAVGQVLLIVYNILVAVKNFLFPSKYRLYVFRCGWMEDEIIAFNQKAALKIARNNFDVYPSLRKLKIELQTVSEFNQKELERVFHIKG